MSHAVKLLISGFEASGKSTTGAAIKNAMVMNFDRKSYNFSVPHVNIPIFRGMDELIDTMNTKVGAYKKKFGKLPETVVLDTVTQLYTAIQKYNIEKYKGFDVHSGINKDTLSLNAYVEDVLIANGVNVVVLAHTVYDSETSRHIIPASGAFAKAGSWLSVVNNASFIEKKSGKLVINHKSMKLPCRTTLTDIPSSQPIEDYDINGHLAQLSGSQEEAVEFEL